MVIGPGKFRCVTVLTWIHDLELKFQDALPTGATVLGVILSSDKTNISVITGNRMAHPVLISLANIDANIRSKNSLHGYLLLALLPIAKFVHKDSRIRGLLQDRLTHDVLNKLLSPLRTAASVGVMMSDPVGNLRYCYTPIAAWIADTPEESLIAATSPKASPITVAFSKQFGNPFCHPARTATITLAAIQAACTEHSPSNYKAFLKVCRRLGLNGVIEPFWKSHPLSDPSEFINPEVLHHIHRLFWDHDAQWCIFCAGAAEIDFRFSVLQTAVGYRAFTEGISKLKQVTGRDHRAIQRYIIGVIAGRVPRQFLVVIRALLDFRYLAQAPCFTDNSLGDLEKSLQEFHDNKDAIVRAGARKDSWSIPKLELLQSVVASIRLSGMLMQWSADVTEHAHVQEIKVPARAGNNQNYYSQIARYLDRSEKCFRFDLATHLRSQGSQANQREDGDEVFEQDDEHESDPEDPSVADHMAAFRPISNYFAMANAFQRGSIPMAIKPYRTFATTTTAFHLASKPSLRLSLDEAAETFKIPDLRQALVEHLHRLENGTPHTVSGTRNNHSTLPFDCIQIWYRVRTQQMQYYNSKVPDAPQTLRALPPSASSPHGLYDAVVINAGPQSEWPRCGLHGMSLT